MSIERGAERSFIEGGRVPGEGFIEDVLAVQAAGYATARRIASKVDTFNPPDYLRSYIPENAPSSFGPLQLADEGVWVTDSPSAVFGGSKLYTVTSSQALRNAQGGSLLVPAEQHLTQGVVTHRGLGLQLFPTFMRLLRGGNLGQKDRFVWLGPQIDGEQFAIEDTIAQQGTQLDKAISAVFFGDTELTFDREVPGEMPVRHFKDPHLHPMLKNLITAISQGRARKFYTQSEECQVYVGQLLDSLSHDMAVREGWYNTLEYTLKGMVPPQVNIDPDAFEQTLIASVNHPLPAQGTSQAVVLEIDPDVLFAETPIYPFVLSSRPPGTIVPAAHVPARAVSAVYVEGSQDPSTQLGVFAARRRLISELPADAWLSDAQGKQVQPADVRVRGVDPREPVCQLRYDNNSRGPEDAWAALIRDGVIAPWVIGADSTCIDRPRGFSDQVVAKVVAERLGFSPRNSPLIGAVCDTIVRQGPYLLPPVCGFKSEEM